MTMISVGHFWNRQAWSLSQRPILCAEHRIFSAPPIFLLKESSNKGLNALFVQSFLPNTTRTTIERPPFPAVVTNIGSLTRPIPRLILHKVHSSSFRDRLRMLALFRFHPAMARSSRAVSRLRQFKDHLEPPSLFELNTPFSTERSSTLFHETEIRPSISRPFSTQRSLAQEQEKPAKMSTQEAHPALLIPGPIEFDDAVLQAMSHFR
jgi:hypothetical protein